MKIFISKAAAPNPDQFIRRAGYGLLLDRRTGKKSFVRRLDRDLYPRLHIYVDEAGDSWQINLHLDQRQTVYEGATAHSGDYDGPVVEAEAARIVNQTKKI